MKTLTRFFTLASALTMFSMPLLNYAEVSASFLNASAPAQPSIKTPLHESKQEGKRAYQKKDKYRNPQKWHSKENKTRCLEKGFKAHPVFDASGNLIRHEYFDAKGMLRILIIFKRECGCWHETRFDENGKITSEGEYASLPIYEEKTESSSEESSEKNEEAVGESSAVSGYMGLAENTGESHHTSVNQTADSFTQYQYGRKGALIKVIVRYPAKHMQCEYDRKGTLKVVVIFNAGKGVFDQYHFHHGMPLHHTCFNDKGEMLNQGPKPGHDVLIHCVPLNITVNISMTFHTSTEILSGNESDMTPRSMAAVPTESQEQKYHNYYDRRPVGNFRHERFEQNRNRYDRGDYRQDRYDRWERGQREDVDMRSLSSETLKSNALNWKQMLQSRFSSEISGFESMKEMLGKGDFKGTKPLKDAALQVSPEKNQKADSFKAQVKEAKTGVQTEKMAVKSPSLKEKHEKPFKGQGKLFSKPPMLSSKVDALKGKESQIQHKTEALPVKSSLPSVKMPLKK